MEEIYSWLIVSAGVSMTFAAVGIYLIRKGDPLCDPGGRTRPPRPCSRAGVNGDGGRPRSDPGRARNRMR